MISPLQILGWEEVYWWQKLFLTAKPFSPEQVT
jgi:hypothetical protein